MQSTQLYLDLTYQGLLLVLLLSLPAVIASTIVGLLVGLFQAVTQVQDPSIGYGIKLVAVMGALIWTVRVFGPELTRFGQLILQTIAR